MDNLSGKELDELPLDVHSLSVYSQEDMVLLVARTTDDIDHGMQFTIDQVSALINSLTESREYALSYEHGDEEVN